MRRFHGCAAVSRFACAIVAIGLAAVLFWPHASEALRGANKPALDLTGTWSCDDEGTYSIRQVENTVWWMGKSSEEGQWCNLFRGTLSEKNGAWELKGEWADLPNANARNNGNMTLTVTADELKATDKTGGFGGSTWNKKKE